MNSDTGPDLRILSLAAVFLGKANTAIGCIRAIAVADCQICFDPGLLGARQYGIAVCVVTLAFQMGVGVDEHSSR